MQYLIDTDWVIHHLNNNVGVTNRLNRLWANGIGLSIISLAELYQGVFYSRDPDSQERALSEFLSDIEVIPIDDATCRIFAIERGRLKLSGTGIGDMDLLIGATAIRHGLTLLTNNRRHFSRLQGLDIISV